MPGRHVGELAEVEGFSVRGRAVEHLPDRVTALGGERSVGSLGFEWWLKE
jgi:hypothetical protein